ncbi:hypothetical protein AB0P13_17755 [Rhodococcus pyridinivorans]|uniref:hypothetical protein n=1 Tax=Rhodococcus pyridinivorans TaxID=103816 RepID=UPI00341F283E
MRTVNFEIHDETSAVRLSAEWDDLAQEVGRRVATRPSYVLAWNRMGRGRSAVCTVRRDGRLVGLAPLHARTRLGVTALRLPAHGLATIGTFLATDEAALADLLDGIADRNMALQLDHVDLTDPLVEMLQRHLADRHDELGIDRFDYLLGTSEFKEQWSNGDYRVGRIVAVPTSRPHHRWTLRAADLGADLVRPLRLAARDALTSNRC